MCLNAGFQYCHAPCFKAVLKEVGLPFELVETSSG